jgi:hypothetical protein
MSYKLSNYERETIINYNEQDNTADVFTYNGALKRRLSELSSSRPNEIKQVDVNTYGGVTYTVPKSWIKIVPTRILSDENKALRSSIAKNMVANRINKK